MALLFVLPPIFRKFCVGSLFCHVVLSVLSSFVIILLRKRDGPEVIKLF